MDRTNTQARTGQWPNSPAVDYWLAGRRVIKAMYDDAVMLARQGIRASVTTPGAMEMDVAGKTDYCTNCGGMDRLYLQAFIAGPFKERPHSNPENNEHVGYHNGAWFKMTMRAYQCPVCTGKEVKL